MKFIPLIIAAAVAICILYSFRPFIKPRRRDSIVNTNPAASLQEEAYVRQRSMMVEEQIRDRGVKNAQVLDAMRKVERHLFVPEEYRQYSYSDQPLPIGSDQTISQPYIVALMTEMLDVNSDDTILEIGTGSGYQAAVLSNIVKKVYTIEIIEELGLLAGKRLKELGYDNVEVTISDGSVGLADKAPFDAIIVTAAADKIPDPLIEQLRPGGKMVIPVDNSRGFQDLLIAEKDEKGNVHIKNTIPVRFVPLVEK